MLSACKGVFSSIKATSLQHPAFVGVCVWVLSTCAVISKCENYTFYLTNQQQYLVKLSPLIDNSIQLKPEYSTFPTFPDLFYSTQLSKNTSAVKQCNICNSDCLVESQ